VPQPSVGNSLEIGTELILPLGVGCAVPLHARRFGDLFGLHMAYTCLSWSCQCGFLLAFLNLAIGSTSSLFLAAFFIFLGATRLPNSNNSMTKTTVPHHFYSMTYISRSLTTLFLLPLRADWHCSIGWACGGRTARYAHHQLILLLLLSPVWVVACTRTTTLLWSTSRVSPKACGWGGVLVRLVLGRPLREASVLDLVRQLGVLVDAVDPQR